MAQIDITSQRSAFLNFLTNRYKDNPLRQQSILHMVEEVLPDYARQHLDAMFSSLYDIKDIEKLREMDSAIYSDPILKQEEKVFGELCFRNIFRLYSQFLKSKANPLNGNYMPPVPVDAELPNEPMFEGAIVQNAHITKYERNLEARKACIEYFKSSHGGHIVCECCGFDFSRAYNVIGEDYIEVHHKNPVSQRGGEYEVNPKTDLVPLCSNCHSMIHRVGGQGGCMSIEELKEKYYIGKIWT